MRIVVNGWFWDRMATGSGQYLAVLTEALPRRARSHKFILVCSRTKAGERQSPEGWQVVHAATPLDWASRKLAKLWFEQVTFPRTCVRHRADLAFVPYWGSPWWPPCPVVVTVHDLIPLLLPLYRGGAAQRAYTQLVSRTARRAAGRADRLRGESSGYCPSLAYSCRTSSCRAPGGFPVRGRPAGARAPRGRAGSV